MGKCFDAKHFYAVIECGILVWHTPMDCYLGWKKGGGCPSGVSRGL